MSKFGFTLYSNGTIYVDSINQPLSYIQHEQVALCNGEIFCFLRDRDGATQRRSWLRHCATSRKVAGSIPDGVIGIFHLI